MLRLMFFHLQPVVLLTLLLYTLSILFPHRYEKYRILSIAVCDLMLFAIHFLTVNNIPFFLEHVYTWQTVLLLLFSITWSLAFLEGSHLVQSAYCLFYISLEKCFKLIMAPFYSLRYTMNEALYQTLDVLTFAVLCLILYYVSLTFRRNPFSIAPAARKQKYYYVLYCPISFLAIMSLSDPGLKIPTIWALCLSALLLILNLPLVYYLLVSVVQGFEDRLRLNQALAEANNKLTRYRCSMELEEKLKKEKHEWKNHYFYMLTLLNDGRTEELKSLLAKRLGEEMPESGLIRTDNTMIDYILNRKLSKAHEAGIRTCTDLLIPAHLPVNENALSTILLNLLDNAIEASRMEKDPDIQISMKCVNRNLVMTVSNKTSPERIAANPELKTTKEDPDHHGLGLAIVRETVEECGGIYSWKLKDHYFVSTVLMPLEEKSEKSFKQRHPS